MDGIQDKGKNVHLYTVGATNKPWSLDWPFLRRFEKRIYIPLPNFDGRISMFKNYTAPINVDAGINLEDLSRISEGYSGSDIRDICQGGQLRVVRELFESGKALDKSVQPRPIVMTDFKEIMKVSQAERLPRNAPCVRELGRAVQGPVDFDLQDAHSAARLWMRLTSIELIRLGTEGCSTIYLLFHNLSIPSSLLEPCLTVVDTA